VLCKKAESLHNNYTIRNDINYHKTGRAYRSSKGNVSTIEEKRIW